MWASRGAWLLMSENEKQGVSTPTVTSGQGPILIRLAITAAVSPSLSHFCQVTHLGSSAPGAHLAPQLLMCAPCARASICLGSILTAVHPQLHRQTAHRSARPASQTLKFLSTLLNQEVDCLAREGGCNDAIKGDLAAAI